MQKVTDVQAADALGQLKAEAAQLTKQLDAINALIKRLTPAQAADLINENLERKAV